MKLPYEVLLQIVAFLDITDKIACLTVCRAWYRPTLEAVYNNAQFHSIGKLRKFINVIAHHPHTPGIYVKRLRLINTAQARNRRIRPMIFTEFELLARYCINLNEFYFNEPKYWCWLVQLNWSSTWLNLGKLPAINSLDYMTRTLYPKLADRLTEFHTQRLPKFDVMVQLLSVMPKIQSIVLGGINWNLTTNELQRLHLAAPQAKKLITMFYVPPSTHQTFSLTECHHASSLLDHLQCRIDHPDSGWFPIIQNMYYNVHTLFLQLVDQYNYARGDESQSVLIFESAVNLIKHIRVQHLEISLRSHDLKNYVEDMIMSLMYEYTLIDPTIHSTVSLELDYFDKQYCYGGNGDRYHKQKLFKSLSTRSVSNGRHGIQNYVHHAFTINFDIPEELDYNEMNAIKGFITHPIHLSVTRLAMTREITRQSLSRKTPYFIYLDLLLAYFQNLESFSLGCIIDSYHLRPLEHQTNYMQLSVSSMSTSDQNKYVSFRSLTVKSIKINRSLYQYLFKKCPNISILKIVDCKLDEETALVLEYLCLQHNVLLCITQ